MATQVELVYTHLTGWSSMNLQGLSLGSITPPPSSFPIPDTAVSIPGWAVPLACPLCDGRWSHHGSPGACPGLAVLLAEELLSSQKLHLSSGAWQASKRLVGNNTWVHTARRVSRFLTGTAAAGEDLAQTTSFHTTQGTVLQTRDSHVCILVLISVDMEFEAGSYPQRYVLSTKVRMWDSSPLPKPLHLQWGKIWRGKPSSLQIKVPTWKMCTTIAVCCDGCSIHWNGKVRNQREE